MCGIAGFWKRPGASEGALTQWGEAMNGSLRHRGPDDGGLWVDCTAGIVLANRRLAILDLSPAGHQPMVSKCGRYVIVYNGEVYNSLEIQQQLAKEGQHCVSQSDTEVLLEACALWGVERTLTRLNGMFGFALWDRGGRTLTLARDRIGIKPLYYGWFRDTFLFGSELKALVAHPDFSGDLDRNSLALFLRFNYIPAPYSIYRNVYKLPPGQFLTLSTSLEPKSPNPYWCAKRMVEEASHSRCRDGLREATDQLDALLRDAVRLQMVADVPLGAFLSGGIDSSTIVAMMQAQSTSAVRTFTIGFNEGSRNEAEHSKGVVRHLGTEHTELYASPELARDVIPLLPTIYDEPFADISQIPTFLVARMARRQVTVSLSGDGGDELFAGYRIYQLGLRRWSVLRRLPSAVRSLSREGLRLIAEAHSSSDGSFMPVRRGLDGLANERFRKIEVLLRATTPELLHQYHVSQWMWPLEVVPGAIEPLTAGRQS